MIDTRVVDAELFAPYFARWNLVADGDEIVTRAARLLPVRQAGEPAMLRVATPRGSQRRRRAARMVGRRGRRARARTAMRS